MWPYTAKEAIQLAERYRASHQWWDAAIEYGKAARKAKDAAAADELRAQETVMLHTAWLIARLIDGV